MTMNRVQSGLQAVPRGARQTLYWIVLGIGLVLGALQSIGVEDLGPLSVSQALQVYAYLSAATGGLAVANVRPADEGRHPHGRGGGHLGEVAGDFDLSAFEPVEDEEDVFGRR
jgi:hypothetical protein